ncbi:hypothetical protein ACHQM5_006593 [Ranunculus cassubicifolius]
MLRDKNPGLKILWLWTIGTAGVLVASVVTTRMRDMQKVMDSAEYQQQQQPSVESTNDDAANES